MPVQFDIVGNLGRSRRDYPLLVVLQSDRASSFSSVIHPAIEIAGTGYVILTERLAAVERRSLGRTIDSAQHRRYEITAALDMVFTGI